jgi:hypothetical protein
VDKPWQDPLPLAGQAKIEMAAATVGLDAYTIQPSSLAVSLASLPAPFYRTVTENELESDIGATVTSHRLTF